jgi:DNA mismatch repair ATPase MutS
MHLDKYIKVLVQQNKRFVALCEEFPNYSAGVKEFHRRVARIITPGTLIDETFLNPYENNYLLAVHPANSGDTFSDTAVGLAWIDVSTGEFFTKAASHQSLRDEIISPKEIVLDERLELNDSHPISQALLEDSNVVSRVIREEHDQASLDVSLASDNLLAPDEMIPSSTTKANTAVDVLQISSEDLYSSEETLAIQLLASYLRANLLEHMPRLTAPNREQADTRMHIDAHTIKALEIRERIRDGGTSGSLLNVVKRTVTSGGTRLLSRWLCKSQ